MRIERRLFELRGDHKLTTAELAEKVGVSEDVVKSWEEGTSMPGAEDWVRIARVYDMSVDKVIYGDEKAPEYDESKAVYSHKVPKKSHKDIYGWIAFLIMPVLILLQYIVMGIAWGLWLEGLILVASIPVYFVVYFLLRLISKNVDKAFEK